MSAEKEALRTAGVVGAGGAGFPAWAKMAEGIDTVIVNAVECEPLLRKDFRLVELRMADIALGAKLFSDSIEAKGALLCLKEENAKLLGLADGEKILDGVFVKAVPDFYPAGDEIILIHEALGRIVPPGKLTSSVGAVVINSETSLNIAMALCHGLPVTEKWLTIGGAVSKPCVVRAPIGTKALDLFALLGEKIKPNHVLIDGGPAMGAIVDPQTAIVKKTTSGFLMLPEDSPSIALKLADPNRLLRRASSACCQCSFCSDQCPRKLLGYPVEPSKAIRSAFTLGESNPGALMGAAVCSECGLCSLAACCQGVMPSAVMGTIKGALAKNGARPGLELLEAPPFRDFRRIPSSRFARLAGAAPYKAPTPYQGPLQAKEVRLLLKQHTGSPSVPAVNSGDSVKAGQLLATPGDGISTALHSPLNGIAKVTGDSVWVTACPAM
ncbi:MAG: 4Fe-4S dicluster domain-containing protein [Clostridiales bacterium]|jgi:Na+-translocating ferredoxin:NAD+ oxidoreductase RnfC subunit|nr:4Fe-4S dicluster domain-containing protein [Clostridiales bacterium]